MRFFAQALTGCLTLGLAACGGTSIDADLIDAGLTGGTTGAAAGDVVNQTDNMDQSFGRILNNIRIGNGASAVTYDSRLDAAAQGHADDMVSRGYFDHNSPEGDDVYDRIVAQGYYPIAWGENIAGRDESEQAALETWQNSPSHNDMMNATTLEEFGLGVSGTGSGTRWVLVMATES